MKAILCSAFADPGGLRLEEVPAPVPGPGEIVIRVRKASVSYMDWLMTEGRYQLKPPLPYVPGTDAAGTVAAVGAGVERFREGDRVACSTWYGAYAQLMVAPEKSCVAIPDGVADAEAASVLYAYGTARYALIDRARIRQGEQLLITGAAGGVGLAMVEVGRLAGARVIAGVGSPAKARRVRDHGADEVIDYRTENLRERIRDITGGHGIDVCAELVGGDLFEQIARSMAWNGRLMPIGFASGSIPTIRANLPLIKNYSVVGAAAGPWWEKYPEEAMLAHEEVFRWLAEGKIRPRIDRELPLEKAREAMELLKTRTVEGRIVLSVS